MSSPRNKPALIVAPERDTPGTNAQTLCQPDDDSCRFHVSCSVSRVCLPTYSAIAMTAEKPISARRDQPQIACASTDFVFEQQAKHADREWCR